MSTAWLAEVTAGALQPIDVGATKFYVGATHFTTRCDVDYYPLQAMSKSSL